MLATLTRVPVGFTPQAEFVARLTAGIHNEVRGTLIGNLLPNFRVVAIVRGVLSESSTLVAFDQCFQGLTSGPVSHLRYLRANQHLWSSAPTKSCLLIDPRDLGAQHGRPGIVTQTK